MAHSNIITLAIHAQWRMDWQAVVLPGLSEICLHDASSASASAAVRRACGLQTAGEALTVRRPIGDNKVGLLPVEVGDDLAGCHTAGDVALYLRDALYGRHRLQIHRYDLWGALWPAGGTRVSSPKHC